MSLQQKTMPDLMLDTGSRVASRNYAHAQLHHSGLQS
jgi:hypothetical protein